MCSSDLEKKAQQMFQRFGYHLGRAIKIVVYILAPEAVILGGSLSRSFQLFEQSMWKEIHDFPYGHVINNIEIFPVQSQDVALVGAASLVEN